MEQIETLRYDENGYKSLVFFENWRVALMNDGPKTTLEGLSYFQKHDETDEVFVLLEGRCVLLMAGFGDNPGEISAVDMEPGSMYNVKKRCLAHPLFCTEYQGCNSGKCRYSSRKFTNQQHNG